MDEQDDVKMRVLRNLVRFIFEGGDGIEEPPHTPATANKVALPVNVRVPTDNRFQALRAKMQAHNEEQSVLPVEVVDG